MARGFLPKSLPLRLVRLAGRRPGAVLVTYLILLGIAGFLATGIRIDSDYLSLLPAENEVVVEFRETVERFGSIDTLLIGLEIEPDADVDGVIEYADILAENLRESENISWVEYRLHDFTDAAEALLGKVSLFMAPEELDRFLTAFTPEGAERAAQNLSDKLRSPLDVGYRKLLPRDPLGAAPLLLRGLQSEGLSSKFDSETGYLIDQNQTLLLMMVKPDGAAADMGFAKALMAELEQTRLSCNQIWAEEEWEGNPPTLIYGGGYPIATAESRLIVDDMKIGIITSLIGVVFLFTFAFGRLRAIVISAMPLIGGLAVTFAFVVLVIGRLNSATSAFAALLIGLGVDFIIVLYSRYLEARRNGADHETALEVFGRHTAVGVLLGAVTTAATFYAFLSSGFKGLSELGLLTGTGILLLVITVFLMLPALLTLLEKKRPNKRFHMNVLGLEKLTDLSMRHSGMVVAFCVITTLAL